MLPWRRGDRFLSKRSVQGCRLAHAQSTRLLLPPDLSYLYGGPARGLLGLSLSETYLKADYAWEDDLHLTTALKG